MSATKKETELMNNKFDIDTVAACDNGAEIELRHPTTDEPTGIMISIVGRDGKIWQGIIARYNNAEKSRQFQAEKRGKKAEPKTYEQNVMEGVEMVAAGITGWRTVERDNMGEIVSEKATISLDDVELNFSEANAIKYMSKRPAYKTQVDEGIADLTNFIKS